MFSNSVSGLGRCIQPNYYRTLAAIEKVCKVGVGPSN